MKKLILLFVFTVAVCACYGNPVLVAPVMDAPTIDGHVTEWESALKLSSFYDLDQKTPYNGKSYVWLGCDDEKLYLAYKIHKSTKPKAVATDREFGAFWEDDDVEFFIQPNKNTPAGYQILTNATGKFRDICINSMPSKKLDIECAASVSPLYDKIGAKEDELFWEGEMSITFESLGIDKNSQVGFSVLGTILNKNKTSYYIYTDITNKSGASDVFNTLKYGTLSFGDAPALSFDSFDTTKFKTNKEITVIFKKGNEELVNQTCAPGDNSIELPKGIYVTTAEFYDNNKLIYSNSVDFANLEIIKTDLDKKNNIYNITLDLSYFDPDKVSFINLYQGERVYMGYCLRSDRRHKVFNCPFDLNKLPKGTYDISINVRDIINQDLKVEVK